MKLTRGQTIIFAKILKDSSGCEIPSSVPVAVRIMDLFGNIVAQGNAFKNLENGNYEFRFVVPPNAEYSNIDKTWTIDWSFCDKTGQIINLVVEFEVVEDSDELPERTVILSEQSKETIEFSLNEKATSLSFEIIDAYSKQYFFTTDTNVFEVTPTLKGYIYSLDFDTTILPIGDYIVKVIAKLPSNRRTQTEIVIARVVPNYFWFYSASLQALLDKARKPGTLVQAYTNSDYYEYLSRGVAMLSLMPPQATEWSFENFPNGYGMYKGYDISHYALAAAACWGLQAQIVMYGELGFSFTGQTITLEHDPSTALGSEIELLLNQVNEQFPKAKEMLLRSMQTTAFTGVRRQFYNQNMSRIDTLRRSLNMQMTSLNSRISNYYVV